MVRAYFKGLFQGSEGPKGPNTGFDASQELAAWPEQSPSSIFHVTSLYFHAHIRSHTVSRAVCNQFSLVIIIVKLVILLVSFIKCS